MAIDPKAPDGDIFESVSLEEFAGRGPFDAALANRALHHIPDLTGALDKVARLLRPGGRLIVHEHAWERMDERTARWYLEHRALIDHAGLYGYEEMRAALDQRFRERFFAWTPYLYAELGGTRVAAEERVLVEAVKIQAIGFNYVGETRARGLRCDVRSRGCAGSARRRRSRPRAGRAGS